MNYYALLPEKRGHKLTITKSSKELGNPDESWQTNGKVIDVRFTGSQMSEFAHGLQNFVDRPVIDETHLEGAYDIALKWSQDMNASPDSNSPPTLFTAITEQLGLKLTATKGPVTVLKIDSLTKPSAN